MDARDVRDIRQALGKSTGRVVSQSMLAAALDLSEMNGRKTIEKWETSGPTGPGGIALSYLAQGALDERMKRIVPEHVFGAGLGDGGTQYDMVVRLWWPRFVGLVLPGNEPIAPEQRFAWLEPNVERLVVMMWIDDPSAFGEDASDDYVRRAAILAQESTIDSMDEVS